MRSSTNRRTSKTRTANSHSRPNVTMPTIGATMRRVPGLIAASRQLSAARSAVVTWKKSSVSSSSGRRGWGRSIVMSSVDPARPRRHHGHPIGQERRLGDRVGDEQHRGAERLAQPAEQVAHVGAGHLVERGERFVHQQDRGVDRERPHQPDALLHAAGQLVRVGVAEVAEADLVEQVVDRRRSAWPARLDRLMSSSSRALASTVRHGSSAGDWGTNPICLWRRASVGVMPLTTIVARRRLLRARRSCAAAWSCRSRTGRAA